ncbi:MAG: site-specific DNA-methyltransferase [Armatimonadetes bacterium]|nr:site-specific DNA-methyltransferase [Armatimonadota bacterium]
MKKKTRSDYNDIDLSNWRDYDDLLTDSLWLMNSRDAHGGHSLDYHGNFIPQIANQVFRRYTRENDIVVDWFLGSGTSAIEAVNLNRRLIGVELKSELVEYVKSKLPAQSLDSNIKLIQGDSASSETAKAVLDHIANFGADKAHLAILHPPYADIIKFSDLQADLSNCPSTDTFLDEFEKVAKNAYDTLEIGRFAVLVIGDKYCAGELDPLSFKCMQKMNDVGFKTKAIIVKNIEGNEQAKGKNNNLWRYRALAGGFYIFKHEYIMVFFKPG